MPSSNRNHLCNSATCQKLSLHCLIYSHKSSAKKLFFCLSKPSEYSYYLLIRINGNDMHEGIWVKQHCCPFHFWPLLNCLAQVWGDSISILLISFPQSVLKILNDPKWLPSLINVQIGWDRTYNVYYLISRFQLKMEKNKNIHHLIRKWNKWVPRV